MNRIDQIFDEHRKSGRRALMPFVCAGYPDPALTGDILLAIQESGASVVEVGIPFSDPISDGPVIAAAMHDALARGVTPAMVFDQVASVRSRLSLGLVAMVSVSIVHRMGGAARFTSLAKQAGFDGLILPDVPVEEAGPLRDAASAAQLTASLLIAPTTPPARAEMITNASTGFVYMLARSGLTGERSQAPDVAGRVARLRQMTPHPIAVGFGVSTPEHVHIVTESADAAIVGSAMVKRLADAHSQGRNAIIEAREFSTTLVSGLFAGAR